MMDDQSFELLLSKLDSLEAGQTRIEDSLGRRMDEHNTLFKQHISDDKQAWQKIDDVTVEVRIAKRIFYILTSAMTGVLGYLGWPR